MRYVFYKDNTIEPTNTVGYYLVALNDPISYLSIEEVGCLIGIKSHFIHKDYDRIEVEVVLLPRDLPTIWARNYNFITFKGDSFRDEDILWVISRFKPNLLITEK